MTDKQKSNGDKVTWKWLVGILLSLVGALFLIGYTNIQGDVSKGIDKTNALENHVMQVTDRRLDSLAIVVSMELGDIKKSLARIERKIGTGR